MNGGRVGIAVNIEQFASNEDERFSEVVEHLKNWESTEEIGEFIDVYVGKLQESMVVLRRVQEALQAWHYVSNNNE